MVRTVIRNGYVWPAADVDCWRAVFNSVEDMDPAIVQCRQRKVAVQAGGNCGVWANWLALRFDQVITFEPDIDNYACLFANKADNVTAYNFALGDFESDSVLFRKDPDNVGAHTISEEGGSTVAMRKLDRFVGECDFLCLDVEGFEMMALLGGSEMIRRSRPVIQIEDKGLSEPHGIKKGDVVSWLKKEFGYREIAKIKRDVILS